ncbi:MAG: hypothetical protein LBM92_01470, partial [Opitutaceae bacterium]|nr:hypothetical protein [Opitutaceae bacterium]
MRDMYYRKRHWEEAQRMADEHNAAERARLRENAEYVRKTDPERWKRFTGDGKISGKALADRIERDIESNLERNGGLRDAGDFIHSVKGAEPVVLGNVPVVEFRAGNSSYRAPATEEALERLRKGFKRGPGSNVIPRGDVPIANSGKGSFEARLGMARNE